MNKKSYGCKLSLTAAMNGDDPIEYALKFDDSDGRAADVKKSVAADKLDDSLQDALKEFAAQLFASEESEEDKRIRELNSEIAKLQGELAELKGKAKTEAKDKVTSARKEVVEKRREKAKKVKTFEVHDMADLLDVLKRL